jgi:beta-glucosidase
MECDKAKRLSYTARAVEIVGKMSLEEKVRLMSGKIVIEEVMADFANPTVENHYNSFPYPAGGNERLGVSEMKFCDGPRGVVCGQSTCFPVSMARGATFDTELEERVGEAIAKEIRAYGGNLFAGVCINNPYNPGWGRSQEVYGEDSFHLGAMGQAVIRGVQKHNVMACVKHFAFNSMENARFKVDVSADPRTEREVYLRHFKDCVDAGAAAVMSAYNKYRGSHCGHSAYLLKEVLKKEWGFDGFVMSDFVWGIRDTVAAATAGLDIEMCNTNFYGAKLVDAVKAGKVPESDIDEAALRIVRTLIAFASAKDPQEYPKSLIACEAHRRLALEVAEKSLTLLKNEGGILPFSKKSVKRLAIVGSLADAENTGDWGSSRVFPPYAIRPKAGLARLLPDCEILHGDGSDPRRDAELARDADAAVIVVGYSHDDEGEFVEEEGMAASVGGDRKKSLGLHPEDIALIQAVCAANPKSVVVLVGGNMIMVEEWKKDASAILMAYYPGMEGGTAIARVLFGEVNPSGKLPFAVPARQSDLPEVDWEAERITYGYYHGYQKLQKEGCPVSYPYGFGLSYTSFGLSDAAFSVGGDSVTASCRVSNEGSREGDEVLQLYVGFSHSMVDRPVKALLGFARVNLKPGESKRVSIACPIEKLKWYNPKTKVWELERMEYEAYLGRSSADEDSLRGSFFVKA